VVATFVKGMTKEAILRKNINSRSKQPMYKESGRDHFSKNDDVSTSKRFDQRYVPYIAKKD